MSISKTSEKISSSYTCIGLASPDGNYLQNQKLTEKRCEILEGTMGQDISIEGQVHSLSATESTELARYAQMMGFSHSRDLIKLYNRHPDQIKDLGVRQFLDQHYHAQRGAILDATLQKTSQWSGGISIPLAPFFLVGALGLCIKARK